MIRESSDVDVERGNVWETRFCTKTSSAVRQGIEPNRNRVSSLTRSGFELSHIKTNIAGPG